MADRTPLTKDTAKLGDFFHDQRGNLYQRQNSPYSSGNTIDVLQTPQADQGTAAPSTPHLGQRVVHVAPTPAEPEAAASTPATQPAIQPPSTPVVAAQPQSASPHLPDDLAGAHLDHLNARQDQADQNSQAEDELLAQQLSTPVPPSKPDPVPTIAQQPQTPIAEASMLPAGALGDIAKGAVEAPSMAISGAWAAVHNMVAYSDHLNDLVQEHVPIPAGVAAGLDIINPVGAAEDMARTFSSDHKAATGFDDAVGHVPLIGEDTKAQPTTVTGGLVRGISQFATGYAIGGAELKAWKVAAATGKMVKSFAQGAIADFSAFDGQQQRFSDMLRDHVPSALAPVVDYLASDPRDSETEGRLKNALEGLGLGAAMHGVISGARYLRSARIAQRAAGIAARSAGLQGIIDAPQDAVEAEAEKFVDDLKNEMGNVGGKGFTITRKFPLTPEEIARVADSGEQGPNTIGLNYSKISDMDDLQAASVQFYDGFHGELTEAKRGVQPIEKQIKDAFGVDIGKMLGEWKPGTAVVSHEMTALRFAQAGGMSDVVRLARQIAGGDATLATQAAFLQAGHITDALSRAVEGGKAEAARTLNALRNSVPTMTGDVGTAEGAVEFYRKVDAMIAGGGGQDMIRQAAKQFLTVAGANPLGTSKMLRGFAWLGKFNDKSKDVLNVFMTNGLLTAKGITDNVIGNASALVWERLMRQAAPHLANMVGSESYIATGEAVASQTAVVSTFGDVFRLSDHINAGWNPLDQGKVLAKNFADAKANTKGFISSHREEVKASQGTPVGGIGQQGLERGPEVDTPLGRVAAFLYGAVKIPGKTHGVLDDFSNIISGRAELASQAYRQATKDAAAGLITEDQIGAQMHKHMQDPDANMLTRVIAAQQNTSWTRQADTSQAALTQGIMKFRNGMNNLPIPLPLGTRIFPFVNTPANLFSYGIQNSIFAPLSSRFRADFFSSDGATRQLATTKYAIGSLMSLWIMNHVANGTMTGAGPKDPAQREAMMRVNPDTHEAIFQPYSARVGDSWVDQSRMFQPFANNFMLSADLSEGWLGNDWTDGRVDTATDAFSAVSMAFGNAFLDRSVMQGAKGLMAAMADGDKGQYGASDKLVEQTVPMLDPLGAASMTARKAVDPYQREVRGVVDAFVNTVPGLSSSLPQSFDLWGRPRTYDTGMGTAYDTAFSSRVRPIGGEPADREMLRLGFAKQTPPPVINTTAGDANLRNHPAIANEILTRGGPGALAELNDLVNDVSPMSGYYDGLADGSDPHQPGTKARYLQGVLNNHFSQAKASVARDFHDDLLAIATEQAQRKADARTGP
jgi:hypothetical protein